MSCVTYFIENSFFLSWRKYFLIFCYNGTFAGFLYFSEMNSDNCDGATAHARSDSLNLVPTLLYGDRNETQPNSEAAIEKCEITSGVPSVAVDLKERIQKQECTKELPFLLGKSGNYCFWNESISDYDASVNSNAPLSCGENDSSRNSCPPPKKAKFDFSEGGAAQSFSFGFN